MRCVYNKYLIKLYGFFYYLDTTSPQCQARDVSTFKGLIFDRLALIRQILEEMYQNNQEIDIDYGLIHEIETTNAKLCDSQVDLSTDGEVVLALHIENDRIIWA